VNHAAGELQKYAKAIIDKRSETGLKIVEAIKVKESPMMTDTPVATVYIDGAQCPEAVYAHERYHDIIVKPKVAQMLWIPLTAAGRRHTLHTRDAVVKRLKGWIPRGHARSTRTAGHGVPFGYWSDDNKDAGLDFVLVRQARIPAYKNAGYLTRTAIRMRTTLIADISRTIIRTANRIGIAA
jgi:hypothetical protein